MIDTYWTTFAIADEISQGRSRHDRHRAFFGSIARVASTAVWNGTPHFVMFDSHEEIDEIKNLFRSVIDDAIDLFVLANVSSKSSRIVGANPDPDIFKLMSAMEIG